MTSFNKSPISSNDPSYIHAVQVLDRIKEMHNAKSSENWRKYYLEFHSVGTIISPYLDNTVKKQLQDGYDRLEKAIAVIKKTQQNEKTQENMITDLKKEFALSYEVLVITSLTCLDIIKKTDDGEIKMDDYELKTLEELIRESSSNVEISRKISGNEDDVE